MSYLPVFLRLDGRLCVVVGGGEIAERKVRALLDAEARVVVVSPKPTAALRAMAAAGAIVQIGRRFRPADLDGAALVHVAVDDAALGVEVAAEAGRRAIPVNVVDMPDLCTFITPAVARRGALQIAVSTSGASPALARALREELEARFGPEYSLLLEILRAARRLLRQREPDAPKRARILDTLARSGLAHCLAHGEAARAERLVIKHVGAGLVELGIDPALLNTERRAADHPAR